MSDLCNFPQLLAREGVKPTVLRLAVLEVLGAAPMALRAQEILEAIRAQRRVNKVTIYRILDDFTRRGILRRLALEDRASHYELACEHHPPHPHFQCHHCGQVQCLKPTPLDYMWKELQAPPGNRADRIDILVAGVCHKCRENV